MNNGARSMKRQRANWNKKKRTHNMDSMNNAHTRAWKVFIQKLTPAVYLVLAYKASIDYCSTIWDGTLLPFLHPRKEENLQKVEIVQRRAARLIYDDYTTSSKSCFKHSIRCMTVAQRIDNNEAVLVHRRVNNLLLEYMNDMCTGPDSLKLQPMPRNLWTTIGSKY